MTADGLHVGIGVINLHSASEVAPPAYPGDDAVEKVVDLVVELGSKIYAAVKTMPASNRMDSVSGF